MFILRERRRRRRAPLDRWGPRGPSQPDIQGADLDERGFDGVVVAAGKSAPAVDLDPFSDAAMARNNQPFYIDPRTAADVAAAAPVEMSTFRRDFEDDEFSDFTGAPGNFPREPERQQQAPPIAADFEVEIYSDSEGSGTPARQRGARGSRRPAESAQDAGVMRPNPDIDEDPMSSPQPHHKLIKKPPQ